VAEYREERAKEVVHCAGLPRELLEYIQGQIRKVSPPCLFLLTPQIEVDNFVSITQAWQASPATMEWCIGTLLNEEGNQLDDCMVFECNLVISKFWIRFVLVLYVLLSVMSILGSEVYEAIINHELAHLEQNHVNLEQHILKTLCKLKNKQPGNLMSFFSLIIGVTLLEKWRRYKVLREYLLWLEYNADQKASLSADAALKMYTFLSSAWLSFELFDTGVHPATRKRKKVVEEALFRAEAEEWLEKRKICRKCPDFQNCQADRSSENLKSYPSRE
jgi:hypothetical protein